MSSLDRRILLACIFWLVTRLVLVIFVPQWRIAEDVVLYQRYAEAFLQGQVPYLDYKMEYPPAALLVYLIPAIFTSQLAHYNVVFALLVLLFEGVAMLLISKIMVIKGLRNLQASTIVTFTAVNSLLAFLLFQRYDIVPAVFTLGILWGCYKKSRLLAWGFLSAGFAVKLYPIVLAPLVFLFFSKHYAKTSVDFLKELAMGVGIAGVVLGITWGPFWYSAGDKVISFMAYHGDRGIQLESIYANVLELFSLFGGEVEILFNYGAWHLEAPMAALASRISPWIMALFYSALYVVLWFKSSKWTKSQFTDRLPELFLLLLMTFLLTGKVLSPQFMIWILPFVLLAGEDPVETRKYWFYALAVAGCTFLTWPVNYNSLIDLTYTGILTLTVRNGILLLLAGYLIRKGLLKSPAKNMRDT